MAEDTLNETEGTDAYPALREATAYTPGASTLGSKIVVGVASIDIKPGSLFIGLFQPPCELINTPVGFYDRLTWRRLNRPDGIP